MNEKEEPTKLVGIVGEHGDKGRMEELTADQASGLAGLIKNPYVSFVALSVGFAGFMYGYPGVRTLHDLARLLSRVLINPVGCSLQYSCKREFRRTLP
jgi:hypothetical protein